MQNKSEHKKKLEKQRQILIHRIQEINKKQDELMLKNILLNARKEELKLKSDILQKLIIKMSVETAFPQQILEGPYKSIPMPVTLYLN